MPEQFPIREIYWNIPHEVGQLFIYTLIIAATIIMTWGILRDIRRWRKGQPDFRIDQLPKRIQVCYAF